LICPIIFYQQNKKLFTMATLYNKTALKKIRKKELVQMFLDKQAREINYSMEDEIEELKNDLRLCAEGLIPHGMVGGIVECEREKRHKAEEENKKLKEQLERERGFALQAIITRGKDFQPEIDDLKEENEALKEENEELKEELEEKEEEVLLLALPRLEEENKKLKEDNNKLKEELDEWETEYCRVESNAESLEWDLKDEIKKLKEENEKLKADITIHPDYETLVKLTEENSN
jgi:chromosome segregation ATPase